MKNAVAVCSYLLLLAASAARDVHIPCPPATSADKDAVITELLCIENYNKNMVLQRNAYGALQRGISGQDGSDCLAIRCIHPSELLLKLTATEAVSMQVELRLGSHDYVTTNEPAKPLNFNGILGSMPKGVTADSCQRKPLSYLQLNNTGRSEVTITGIELKLHYSDDSYKVVFEDKQARAIAPSSSLKIYKQDILNNQAFIRATAGSCHDH